MVLSILVGMTTSFPVLEHIIESKRGVLQRCFPYSLQDRISDEREARQIGKLAKAYGGRDIPDEFLPINTHKSTRPDYITFWWRELGLLSLLGFAMVWFICGLTGWIIIPFIFRGFQGSSVKGGETGEG